MKIERFEEIMKYLADVIQNTEFEGHVFAVGGCVRDMQMHNDIKDIDLCVDIPEGGIKFSEFILKKDLGIHFAIYPTYGTAMFTLKEFPNYEIEAVQTRGEQYHDKDSRNPVVTFAPLPEDAIRRDLTMNALYINISTGQFMDPTGNGITDIENRLCRVTNEDPDVVFTDDPLRILRVIRFACRYGFNIDVATYEAMRRNADRLSIITQERITDEFNKMIVTNNPVQGIEHMRELNVLKYVVPELCDTIGMTQNDFHFGDVYSHTIAALENCRSNSLVVRLACVFHDIGKINTRTVSDNGSVHFYEHEFVGAKMTHDIMMRMRYPKNLADEVAFLVKYHMYTKAWRDDLSHMYTHTLRKIMYKCGTEERFNNLLYVIDADNKAHAKEHCMFNQVERILDYVKTMPSDERMFGYKLPVNGVDIMNELAISPGRDVKCYLDHCMKLAFRDPKITKEACIKHCKSDKIKGIK